MARRLTAAQAKAAKQKKLVIVLAVVFVAVAAIQGPRLMKQLHPKAAGMAPPTPGSVAASPTVGAGAAPAPAAPSQLHTFKGLRAKDPFKPLVSVPVAADSSSSPPPSEPSEPKPSATPKQAAAGEAPASGTVHFSESKPPPNAAIVITNGKRQLVYVGDGFPTAAPLFRLVALGNQTVRVGVLSGGFSSGVPTIKLIRGRRVTLANEADGSHYVIELIRLATAAPKQAPAATATPAATTTTPATAAPTTTSPTTTTPAATPTSS